MRSSETPAQELLRRDKLRYLSNLHIRELYGHLAEIESDTKRRRIFSTDKSFVLGDYVAMIRRNNFDDWVHKSSDVAALLRMPYYRVMPIPVRNYGDREVVQIKYALHTVLSLGAIVLLPIVDRLDYLERVFGEQNTLLVERSFSIRGDHYYQPGETLRLQTTEPDNLDLFLPFLQSIWRDSNDVLLLKYRANSYSTGVIRKEPLKRYYCSFLSVLQQGKCALCKGRFSWHDWEIDHVYPTSRGGTNTLINLQNLCGPCNKDKGDWVEPSEERIAGPRELTDWGLDSLYPYSELTFRTRTTNPFHFVTL
jgi:hypothetical protein